MYNDGENKLELKKVILIIALIVLALFILMWLFPTKQFLNKSVDGSLDKGLNKKLNPVYERVFSENIKTMQDAATSYFTDARLPKNTGSTTTLTLGQMIDKHLLTELIDGNGDTCDREKSFVDVTKEDDEYVMKINLSCSDDKDYILVYMGNYSYCASGVCEKKTEITETNAKTGTNNTCEYQKITNAKWSNYSNWSNWQTKKIEKTNYNVVETKTERVVSGTNKVPEKQTITKAATQKTKVSYICDKSYDNAGTYSTYTKCIKTYAAAVKTKNGRTIYECSSSYDNVGIYTYNVTCRKTYAPKENKKTIYECSNGYDNVGIYMSPTTCKKTNTTYKNVNQYQNVTYYRQKTRTLLSGAKDIKWSNCNDTKLISSGYTKTGNAK